jgi:hypothetical protein
MSRPALPVRSGATTPLFGHIQCTGVRDPMAVGCALQLGLPEAELNSLDVHAAGFLVFAKHQCMPAALYYRHWRSTPEPATLDERTGGWKRLFW